MLNLFKTVSSHGVIGKFLANGIFIYIAFTFLWFFLYQFSTIPWLNCTWGVAFRPKLSGLNSIFEIAIGVNLALSLIDGITSRFTQQQTNYVEQFNAKNPTFSDSAQAVLSNQEFLGAIQVKNDDFLASFQKHLLKELEEFRKACVALTSLIKTVGGILAGLFFVAISTVSLFPEREIPWLMAAMLSGAAAIPLLAHILGILCYSGKFIRDVEGFKNHKGGDGDIAREIMRVFKDHRKSLKKVENVIKNADE